MKRIYLNNAATSYPKPPEVIEAVRRTLEAVPYHGDRVGFTRDQENVMGMCREKLAQLLNARHPLEIVFTSGATESLNLAIMGLNLAGGHVVTTQIEHNSVLRPLKTLERQGIIELSIVACDSVGYVKPKDIANALRDNTRLVVINHCSNVTGKVQDIKSISSLVHQASALCLVDASQSMGHVSIDVQADQPDMVAFTGHKSLYGLAGTGGLYLREDLELSPLKVGGTGIRSDLLLQPEDRPIRYEAGTANLVGIAALRAGVDFILKTGVSAIHEVRRRRVRKLVEALRDQVSINFYGDVDGEDFSGPVCINIEDMAPEDVGYCLEESFGVITRSGLHCAPLIHQSLDSYPKGSVRISPSYFTTDSEIDLCIDAIEHLCASSCAL